MQFGIYDFLCQIDSETVLPDYKGSTIRGSLGHALRNLVCTLTRQECQNCLLNQRCIYALFFETPLYFQEQMDKRFPSPPTPYVIEPTMDSKRIYQKGDHLPFRLILFGTANSHLPYVIYAIEQMGRVGLGKMIDGHRGKFVLKSVSCGNEIVYSDQTKQIVNIPPESFSLKNCVSVSNMTSIKVILKTPLRFKYQNRLIRELPFHVLVRAGIRRLTSLFNYYGEGEPDMDYKQLVIDAEKISSESSNIQWFDWDRYSNRQSSMIKLGGISGDIIYHGNVAPFASLLSFCQMFHVGKQTAFGLGKINIQENHHG